MADPRFFANAGPFSLSHLARVSQSEIRAPGPGDKDFKDVAPLHLAGPDDVSFLDNRRYLEAFQGSAAGACVVAPNMADKAPDGMALLISPKPYWAYAHVADAFYPEPQGNGSHHASAIVHETVEIGAGSSIGAYAVVGPKVSIGPGCEIGHHVVVEQGVSIGEGSRIGAHASLSHCEIGANCRLHAGVRIGNRGFGFAMDPSGHKDVPQLGRVIIEDGVEIGANSTVDRGTGPDTVIGAGSKIDNLVQIGHNVRIGRGCVLVAQSGIAGSTVFEDFVALGAQAGVAGHLTVGQGAQLAAQSGVMRDIPAGQRVAGAPAIPVREFFRLVSLWHRQIRTKGGKDE